MELDEVETHFETKLKEVFVAMHIRQTFLCRQFFFLISFFLFLLRRTILKSAARSLRAENCICNNSLKKVLMKLFQETVSHHRFERINPSNLCFTRSTIIISNKTNDNHGRSRFSILVSATVIKTQ